MTWTDSLGQEKEEINFTTILEDNSRIRKNKKEQREVN